MPSEKNHKQKVLVTGIGGNVGQGILRNIRNAFPELSIVGTDIEDFTAGHYFCDHFEKVPYSYESHFSKSFLKIIARQKPDLIIPSTDYESVAFAKIQDKLPPVIASPLEVGQMFLDKFTTWEKCAALNVPFAPSCLPKDYHNQWKNIIVKPREGRGSRGLHINPSSLDAFDDTSMVQELLVGKEVTSAFYVTKTGEIRGPFTMERALVNGMTGKCQVICQYDEPIAQLVSTYVSKFDIIGPCNIQSIVTGSGDIIPFEINCRYSGTNSIRTHFGFADVKWGIEEYLLNQTPSDYKMTKGSAVRLFMDIIYYDCNEDEIGAGPEGAVLA
jgi:carbamoyl-phosphate synthase large subunit